MTLASVAIPFCDERGHVVSGRHVLRLWTNRHDVITMPPGQVDNPVLVGRSGDGGVELHVEFDSFSGTIATAPQPCLWSLSTAVANASGSGGSSSSSVTSGNPASSKALALPGTGPSAATAAAAAARASSLPPLAQSFTLEDAAAVVANGSVAVGANRRYSAFAYQLAAPELVPFLHISTVSSGGGGTGGIGSPSADDKLPIIEKTGWMKKRGKALVSKWRRRWFVLSPSDSVLSYYESNMDVVPRGKIDLHQAVLAPAPQFDQRHQRIVGSTRKDYQTYTFSVGKPGSRQYYISCDSKQEMEDWMESIKTVVCTIKPRPPPVQRTRRLLGLFRSSKDADSGGSSSSITSTKSTAALASPVGTGDGDGVKSLLSRRKSLSTLGHAGPDGPRVQWGQTALLTMHGPEGVDRWRKLAGSTALWVSALEGLVATEAKALPLFSLRTVRGRTSSAAVGGLRSPSGLASPVGSTGSGGGGGGTPSFKMALNDPMLLISFAVFLDRGYAMQYRRHSSASAVGGSDGGSASGRAGGAASTTASHLLFWLTCERVLRPVATSDDVLVALGCARKELATLLQTFFLPLGQPDARE